MTAPLHPQVRLVDAGDRTRTLYLVEAYDGDVWEQIDPMPMARDWAEKRARWLSDVLEHARDAALEEAACARARSAAACRTCAPT